MIESRVEREIQMRESGMKTYEKLAALLLLVSAVAGWFGEMYVPSIMMAGDAASTAAQLTSRIDLFRLGFVAYLVEACSDVVLAWLFYVILKAVNRDVALLSVFFGLVSTALFAMTQLVYFAAPVFLKGSAYLAPFSQDQLAAFSRLFIALYGTMSGITLLFYGIGWLIRGYLTVKSGYLPAWLGTLMLLAGAGFVAKTLTYVLAPAYSPDVLLAPMFLNIVAVALWLGLKGMDRAKFRSAAERTE